MKTKLCIFLISVSLRVISYAQVFEDFSDGDFINSPSWQGQDSIFEVLNQELHLNAPAMDNISYLSLPSESINKAIWEFQMRMEFNPSSSNYAKFYLVSDSANLAGSLNGYFVKVGSTSDDISLYRQSAGSETLLIDGTDGILNLSTIIVSVRVTRDSLGNWELFSDLNSTGNYVSEGVAFDDTFVRSGYSGLLCKYTSTRSTKFYLDNIVITGNPYQDFYPPEVISILIAGPSSMRITFSEELDPASLSVSNFHVPQLGFASSSSLVAGDLTRVDISFSSSMNNGFYYDLSIEKVTDLSGNIMDSAVLHFLYFVELPANSGDVVINEFFPDPAPRIQLPESEFIELYNTSDKPFDLSGWEISDGTTVAFLGSFLLLPDSLLIICPASYKGEYEIFGSTMGLSPWPSQNNSGDFIILKDSKKLTIDSIQYSSSWFQDPVKADGGWSLERLDPGSRCKTRSNWRESLSENGGTPGKGNSVWGIQDISPPQVVDVIEKDLKHLSLVLNEPVELTTLPGFEFILFPDIKTDSIIYNSTTEIINIYLQSNILSNIEYQIKASGASDCFGNMLTYESSFTLDYLPPTITSVSNIHNDRFSVTLSEPILNTSITKSNFQINDIVSAKIEVQDPLHLTIFFNIQFTDKTIYVLQYNNLKDVEGNIGAGEFQFTYSEPYDPQFGDLVITEIMADPEPGLGILPISQYLEIFNRSGRPISLVGLRLADAKSSTALSNGFLLEGEYAVLVPSAQALAFAGYGQVIAVSSWPSFNKTSESVSLINRQGQLIHRVDYEINWYGDPAKKEGGWSLEMIDPGNLCGMASNWAGSQSQTGGTPALANSVTQPNPDVEGPQITSIYVIDSINLQVEFNEWIKPEHFPQVTIDPSVEIKAVSFDIKFPNLMVLLLHGSLQKGTKYLLTAESVDCNGNFSSFESDFFYLPENCEPSDIVINEIYFNPLPGGTDFVELFNQSSKHILLQGFSQYSFRDNDKIGPTVLTENYRMLHPGDYLVLTSSPEIFKNYFPFVDTTLILKTLLPSLPDDEGYYVFQNSYGVKVDSIFYSEDWHHPLLENREGVSLERLSATSTSTAQNWKSASSTEGFATPGRKNSHSILEREIGASLEVSPDIFSPGTGSINSFCTIRYHFDQTDLIGTINIFNNLGRLVRHLEQNQLLSTTGYFIWDGTDDHGNKTSIGHYFIVFDVYSPSGYQKRIRRKVVVGL